MMLAPSSWQTWFLIGRDHRQLGHAEVARLAYRRGLAEAPEEPVLLGELGTLLNEMGLEEEAYPMLVQAADRCPVDPGLRLQVGLADLERDDLLGAQRNLTLAKHLDPGDRRIDLALQELSARKRNVPRKRRRKAA
jgi:Tfp pilus assembly protein PilF